MVKWLKNILHCRYKLYCQPITRPAARTRVSSKVMAYAVVQHADPLVVWLGVAEFTRFPRVANLPWRIGFVTMFSFTVATAAATLINIILGRSRLSKELWEHHNWCSGGICLLSALMEEWKTNVRQWGQARDHSDYIKDQIGP